MEEEEHNVSTRLLTYNIKVGVVVSNKVRGMGVKYPAVMGVIITNMLACLKKQDRLMYSRRKQYKPNVNSNKKNLNPTQVIKCVDILVELGYAINVIGNAHSNKENRTMSYIVPTDEFIKEFCTDEEQAEIAYNSYMSAYQTIQLRDEKGLDTNFFNTQRLKEASELVQNLNKINEACIIRVGDAKPLTNFYCRIFNTDMDHGGRFYKSDVLRIKNKKTSTRLEITIDGEEIVEVDYNSLHFRICAAKEGIDTFSLPKDVYMDILPDDEKTDMNRLIVKLAVNIMFNAKDKKSAQKAIQEEVNKYKDDPDMTFTKGAYVHFLIMEAFPKFSKYFCRDDSYGLRLQNDDSWLAHKVLKYFVDQGKPCLPVHDSFIVKRSDIDLLTKAMGDSFREQFDVEDWVPVTINWKDEGEVYKKSVVV